jgi:hypothetical protein
VPLAAHYTVAGPAWEVGGTVPATSVADDGGLNLRRAEFRWALADVRASGDFMVEAAIDFGSGAGFGLLFRACTDDHSRLSGYSFDLDPVYTGGAFLLRQWDENRQHWKPLAHVRIADAGRLYGPHVVTVTLRGDRLDAYVDEEPVLAVENLGQASYDAGRPPCDGDRVGIQAWSSTEVIVGGLRVGQY